MSTFSLIKQAECSFFVRDRFVLLQLTWFQSGHILRLRLPPLCLPYSKWDFASIKSRKPFLPLVGHGHLLYVGQQVIISHDPLLMVIFSVITLLK